MDAGNLDQIRDLHLICHVIKNNKMGINNTNDNTTATTFNTLTSSKKSTCFRRPYACADMNISKIITKGKKWYFVIKIVLTYCELFDLFDTQSDHYHS